MVIWDRMEVEKQKGESLCRTKTTSQESGSPASLVSQHLHLSDGIIIPTGTTLPGCSENQERQYNRIRKHAIQMLGVLRF